MGIVFVTFVLVVVATFAVYFLGTRHGRDIETRTVAVALAKYRSLNNERAVTVNQILGALRADYRKAYTEVVDEIDQITLDLRKAGL